MFPRCHGGAGVTGVGGQPRSFLDKRCIYCVHPSPFVQTIASCLRIVSPAQIEKSKWKRKLWGSGIHHESLFDIVFWPSLKLVCLLLGFIPVPSLSSASFSLTHSFIFITQAHFIFISIYACFRAVNIIHNLLTSLPRKGSFDGRIRCIWQLWCKDPPI